MREVQIHLLCVNMHNTATSNQDLLLFTLTAIKSCHSENTELVQSASTHETCCYMSQMPTVHFLLLS
jgi:hypothetical protein